MATDQENVSKILSVLAHPLRREILLTLSDKGESSFTDFLNLLKVDTGKLSFHLRALSSFMEQTKSGKYKLSRTGEDAVRVIKDVESLAEATDINRKATKLHLASFLRRSTAYLLDLALIIMITSILTFPQLIYIFTRNPLSPELSAELLIILGLLWVYSTLLEGFNGQTLGKRLLDLKVVRTDGKNVSYDHAAVRNFGKSFLLPLDIVVGTQTKNPEFVRYFDKFAGTTVIDIHHSVKSTSLQKEEPSTSNS